MTAGAWAAAASSAQLSATVRAAVRTLGSLFPRAQRPHSTTTTTTTAAAATISSYAPSHTLHDYNRFLAALAQDGDGDGALRVLRRMRLSAPACAPTAVSYTSAMSALAKAGRPADAASLFDDMLANGVAPDRAAFSLLLHVYSSHLHLPAAAHSVLLWMSRLGLPPTPIDYTDLVFSFCRAGRLADALQLLDEMRALNYPLTPHAFAPILQGFCQNGDIEGADALISSMRSSGCHPDVVIYNIYIEGLCKYIHTCVLAQIRAVCTSASVVTCTPRSHTADIRAQAQALAFAHTYGGHVACAAPNLPLSIRELPSSRRNCSTADNDGRLIWLRRGFQLPLEEQLNHLERVRPPRSPLDEDGRTLPATGRALSSVRLDSEEEQASCVPTPLDANRD